MQVLIEGTFSGDSEEALRLINLYRYQACYQNMPDPRDRSQMLLLADDSAGYEPSDNVLAVPNGDYVPAQWDAGLQRIAEMRSAEYATGKYPKEEWYCLNGASVYDLVPDGATTEFEGRAVSEESLTEMVTGFSHQQSEWEQDTEYGLTYGAMISPDNRYFGLALFFRDEAYSPYGAGIMEVHSVRQGSEMPIERTGTYAQIINMKADLFEDCWMKIIAEREMEHGEEQTLSLSVGHYSNQPYCYSPYGPIEWSSSNPEVATVDEYGCVHAIRQGETKITAKFAAMEAQTEWISVNGWEFPVTGQCGDNVFWTVDEDRTLTFTGTGDMWDTNFDEEDSYRYTYEELAYQIRRVVVEDGVTSLGDYALNRSRFTIQSVSLSATVQDVGYGNWEFISLTEIRVDPTSPYLTVVDDVLFTKDMKRLLMYPGGSLRTIYRIPDGVETVAENVASSVQNLETLIVPDGIKHFEEGAFDGWIENVYFLGAPPEYDEESFAFGWEVTPALYYPAALADLWAPNGETTWGDNYPIQPYGASIGEATFHAEDVQYKGTTPYVIANGEAQTPRAVVKDDAGRTLDPSAYTVTYRDNTEPGTAYADVQMITGGPVKTLFFKIYLPATTETKVVNTRDGVKITWTAVEGAKKNGVDFSVESWYTFI